MLNERFMCEGTRPNCGEIIDGYVLYSDNLLPSKAYICAGIESAESIKGGYIIGRFFEVDPASVEPVAVKVEKIQCGSRLNKPIYCGECPNCGLTVASAKNYPYELNSNDYCGHCGQRLDWGGAE